MSAALEIGARRGIRQSIRTSVRALASLFVFVAAATAQPTPTDLRKAPPDSGSRAYGERLTALVEQRYPQLLTKKPSGIPVVTVLLNWDGTVANTHLEVAPEGGQTLTASEESFARFGLPAGRLQYIGVGRIKVHNTPAIVVFGGTDSRDLDRSLIERYFPNALTTHRPPHDQLWILLDHAGRVLRTGEELSGAEDLRKTLEARFPGIRIADMTAGPVRGPDGRPLEDIAHQALDFNCIWLAEDSPLPR